MSNSERREGAQINTAPKSPDSVVANLRRPIARLAHFSRAGRIVAGASLAAGTLTGLGEFNKPLSPDSNVRPVTGSVRLVDQQTGFQSFIHSLKDRFGVRIANAQEVPLGIPDEENPLNTLSPDTEMTAGLLLANTPDGDVVLNPVTGQPSEETSPLPALGGEVLLPPNDCKPLIGSEKLTADGDRWHIRNLDPKKRVCLDISPEDFARINSLLGPGPGTGPRFTEVNVYGPDADLPGWGTEITAFNYYVASRLLTPTQGFLPLGREVYRLNKGRWEINLQFDPRLGRYYSPDATGEDRLVRDMIEGSNNFAVALTAYHRIAPIAWPGEINPETGFFENQMPPDEFQGPFHSSPLKLRFAAQ